jgi:dienelactone hydrolase
VRARGAWLVLAAALLSSSVSGQTTFTKEELRIPAPGVGKRGLQVLFVKPDLPGRLPLVVITHGAPVKAEDRRKVTPIGYLAVANEFARRGWATAIVMRRGFGNTDGEYVRSTGTCERPNFEVTANADASDLRASIAYLQKRTDIDGSRLLAVGASAGGLSVTALTADPPPGLIAAISFAGGVRASRNGKPCEPGVGNVLAAFKTFGKRSRIPMLWIYSDNDSVFPPEFARQYAEAFSTAGGKVDYIKAPPFRSEGHILVLWGIPQWTPYVDEFLKKRGLVALEEPLPAPRPIQTPKHLTEQGRKMFDEFFLLPPNRAMAVSPTNGALGRAAGNYSLEDSKKAAFDYCSQFARDCRVVVVNDEAVP